MSASSWQGDGNIPRGLEVTLAGRVSIRTNRVLIDEERLPGRQGRLVFAYLVSENGRAVPRDELAEALWGERPPASWEKALSVIASKLRALLAECGLDGAKLLTGAFGCYRLELPAGSWVDVLAVAGAVEEAEAALAACDPDMAKAAASRAASLARQPLLPGEDGVWVEERRRELADLLARALDCLADACLRSGHCLDAAKWAQEAIGLEPFRESGYRRLMAAHAAAGNRAEALRAYERCRRLLAEELGAYPSPETDSIYRELLSTAPSQEQATALSEPGLHSGGFATSDDEPARAREVRKTVTVFFADLDGWMEIVERLDAEAADRVASRFYGETERVCLRHGGIVERSAGGVIMAAFGLPVAHEDDALRAVRAALELAPAVSALNEELEHDGARVALKVAVNTGDVFVTLDGKRRPRLAGEAVTVAARLEEEAAQPGQILIGSATHKLVRAAVQAEPLGPVALAGRAKQVEVWQVLGLLELSARTRAAVAPLVGRTRELAQLEATLAEATLERTCRLCTLIGPAGIGKSRLVAEFIDGIGNRATLLVGHCLPYGEGITYWPLREIIRELAGDEPRRWISSRLAGEASVTAVAERVTAAVGAGEGAVPPEETTWAFRRLFEALAREQPLVLVIDDVHWAEPTLLDLLEQLVGLSAASPIVLLCLTRPELFQNRPEWAIPQPNRTVISLPPLLGDESRALVEGLARATELPEQARAHAVAVADGNPLFLEQLIAFASEAETGILPPSIQALLTARIDQLESAERRVLERAAIEGVTFHAAAVADLLPAGERAKLNEQLLTLVRKDFIEARRSALEAEGAFQFRHVLLRDAAYHATGKESRAKLHERHADWLDTREGEDEIVGYHLEQAATYLAESGQTGEWLIDLARRAVARLGTAGRAALKRGDLPGALNLLSRACSLGPAGGAARIDLLPDLGETLCSIGELSAASDVLSEAAERAQASGDFHAGRRARLQQAWLRHQADPRVDVDAVLDEAEQSVSAFEHYGDDRALAHAWHLIAWVHMDQGRHGALADAVRRGREHARMAGDAMTEEELTVWALLAGITGPQPAERLRSEAQAELDEAQQSGRPRVEGAALLVLSTCAAFDDRFDEARDLLRAATAIEDELGGRGRAFLYTPAAMIELLAGDVAEAERKLRIGYETLREQGDAWFLCGVAAELADVLWLQGHDDEALELTLLSERVVGDGLLVAQMMWRGARAKILARRGQPAHAERLAREGVELIEQTDHILYHADALTDLAEVLRLQDRTHEAASAATQARRLYQQKGNLAASRKVQALLDELHPAAATG